MKSLPDRRPVRADLLVVAAVLALAGLLFARYRLPPAGGYTGYGLTVVVSVGGEEVERASLLAYSGQHTYTSNGYTVTVDCADGWVDVVDADCPNRDCQRSGAILRAGQSIVCLPAQLVIALEAAGGGDYDLIVG